VPLACDFGRTPDAFRAATTTAAGVATVTGMWRTTIAGLRAHARRMVATALAVVFGVAFVAGTLIFGDTARAGFFDTFSRVAKNIDVAIEAPPRTGKVGPDPVLTAAQVATVSALPHIGAVDARIVQPLVMLDRHGRALTNFGRVGLAFSTDGDPRLRAFDVTGRTPSAPGEAMLDVETAAHQHYAVGDRITVVDTADGRHAYTLVGLIDFGTSKRFSGQSVVGLPASEIIALTKAGGYDEIVALGRGGLSQQALAAEVRAALGPGPVVVTGDQRRTDLANDATSVAEQFLTVLLIFGVISLIVASFVIYNTFAILLAQRIRETALLRCVGATRGQVFTAVVLESVIVGLAGGAVGVAAGIGVAYGLFGLLNGVLNAGIPVHAVVVRTTPILAGLAIGLVVTVVAAFIPAVRATRASPLAALRELPTARVVGRRARVVRLVAAALIGAAGLWFTTLGRHNADPRNGTFTIVAGGVVTFLAVLVLTPLFVGPLTALVGTVPGWLFGTPAKLASANARRNPGRTAVTTATLMIGVGLMSLFSVLIASVRSTASAQLVGHYPVDYVMTGVRYAGDQQASIPPGYAQALRGRAEFAAVAEARTAQATILGLPLRVAAIDPGALGSLIKPQMTTGSLADLRPGTAIVSNSQTALAGLRVGDTLVVGVGAKSATVRVVGTASTSIPGTQRVDALLVWDDLTALAGPGDDTTVMAKAAAGVSPTASRDALDALVDAYPRVEVNSLADLSSDLDNAVNGLIALFSGLLGTAVLIALFGITNTLSLSVVERTRESATARALGLTRGQLRATLLIEALLMAMVGALVGIVYGLVYGRMVVAQAFSTIGPTIVVPWSWLAGLVVLAALAGMLAAVLPARRAAAASIVAAMADT
jgi:putative ABC transport system permease protein